MKTTEQRLAALRARAMAGPCGRRGKYVAGCRCEACRTANREYKQRREWEVLRTAESGAFVDAAPVRRHLLALREQGVGYKQAADAAKVGKTIVRRIRQLIQAGTWPQRWDGSEPTADQLLPAVYGDGTEQPLLQIGG